MNSGSNNINTFMDVGRSFGNRLTQVASTTIQMREKNNPLVFLGYLVVLSIRQDGVESSPSTNRFSILNLVTFLSVQGTFFKFLEKQGRSGKPNETDRESGPITMKYLIMRRLIRVIQYSFSKNPDKQ